jgi:hypothetical protein
MLQPITHAAAFSKCIAICCRIHHRRCPVMRTFSVMRFITDWTGMFTFLLTMRPAEAPLARDVLSAVTPRTDGLMVRRIPEPFRMCARALDVVRHGRQGAAVHADRMPRETLPRVVRPGVRIPACVPAPAHRILLPQTGRAPPLPRTQALAAAAGTEALASDHIMLPRSAAALRGRPVGLPAASSRIPPRAAILVAPS